MMKFSLSARICQKFFKRISVSRHLGSFEWYWWVAILNYTLALLAFCYFLYFYLLLKLQKYYKQWYKQELLYLCAIVIIINKTFYVFKITVILNTFQKPSLMDTKYGYKIHLSWKFHYFCSHDWGVNVPVIVSCMLFLRFTS